MEKYNKRIKRINPELDKLIEEAKRNYKMLLGSKFNYGINQLAQMQVAEWAKNGKNITKSKSINQRFIDEMDKMCK